jgi:hypothetical protein
MRGVTTDEAAVLGRRQPGCAESDCRPSSRMSCWSMTRNSKQKQVHSTFRAVTAEMSKPRTAKSAKIAESSLDRTPTLFGRLRYSIWQRPYLAAMMELDSRKMARKIADAKKAINSRMGGKDGEERKAILTALNALQFFSRIIPIPRHA